MINRLSRRARTAAGLAAWLLPLAAPAQSLPVYNQSALSRAFELPVLGRPLVLGPQADRFELRYDLTSEFHTSQDADEFVLLDGEAQRVTLAWRRGLGGGFEAGLELPMLHQGGGFMDGFIENWHDALALPDGGRPQAPRDRYLYQYQINGRTQFEARETGSDVGDVRANAGWQATGWLALRGELKFATGEQARFSGGNEGGALWLDAALPFAAASRWSGYLAAGVSHNGRSDILPDQQQRTVPFGGVGLALRVLPRLSLLGQLYAHGALYDGSDLKPFREALQLALALRWRLRPDLAFDIGFQEDPITDSSPDFSLHLGLSWG